MQTLVEIGPSFASQGKHRRKNATEQMINLQNVQQTQIIFPSNVDSIWDVCWDNQKIAIQKNST